MTSPETTPRDPSAEELYRALYESAPDAVLVIDPVGTIVAANPQAERLFGYTKAQLEGSAIEALMPERFRAAHVLHRHGYVAAPAPRPMGTGLDLWARHKSGDEFPVEISLSPLRHRDRLLMSASVRDITDRKDYMQRQTEMLDLASEPIFAWDTDRGIVFWNKAAAETYGYSREEAIGRNSHELLATRHELGTSHIREALRRDGRWDGELVHTTRGGSRIVMESRMAVVTPRHGERLVLESCRDITARRAAEEGLRQAQKIEAVGQLTGGIAHDFNNLLTIILANLQLLEDELTPGSPPLELAASATRAAQRGADLTRKLLVFARRQRLESTSLDINELVSSMTGMLARTLGENIRIVESLAPDLPKAFVDEGQLETALLNLAINARDAMAQGGRLIIETGETVVDPHDERHRGHLEPGAYVTVAVSDTGSGMTGEVIARAFEPFFTTKEAGRGTGLGLSMVYGFVKQSGGHVTLQSETGRGTTATLYLPRAASIESSAAATSAMHPTGTETVLLVEDDDAVRQATRKLVLGLGYRVIDAADAATALSLIRQHDDLHLLLTDVVLAQGMSGPELARQARLLDPRLKILFMSGHVRDTVAFLEQLQQDALFLRKPFRKAELAQKLRLALASSER